MGHLDRATCAMKQDYIKIILELLDLVRKRGLCDPQLVCGLAEVQFFGERQKVPHMP